MAKFATKANIATWWQNLELSKCRHMVGKFVTNAAMWSLNLVQVTESISASGNVSLAFLRSKPTSIGALECCAPGAHGKHLRLF